MPSLYRASTEQIGCKVTNKKVETKIISLQFAISLNYLTFFIPIDYRAYFLLYIFMPLTVNKLTLLKNATQLDT